ncbi:PREDICTED: uncharacterized protein LOC105624181 [Atta cephalotes]|uniref:HBS1-like protein N-terminal domain-containing protein n=1 Tax=Atta cephalotes TaxID=12957 RepID=A0A158NTS2_ATTCE|nr:PREDICTED: uncharacterized protein LOC105624181 [Atta cephalotes]
MSRHRDVRSMNYSDEYDAYDDVYGHSIEDDYCVSPSVEQFLFDRSKQQNIASFITEPDIVEDNEDIDESSPLFNEEKFNLSELEKAKLMSCLETIRNVIGDTVSDSKLKEKIILSNFDANIALDAILKESSPKKITDSIENKKEQLERHPDVSVDESNTYMLTIPRFSFKKEHISKNSTWTICQPNNVDNSKDVNNSFKTFSSLAGIVSHHTESTNSNITKIFSQNNTNAQPFSSLAALTADYLQKSNATNNVESQDRYQSPVSQFIIPKLSIKKNDGEEMRNIHLPKFHNNENNKRQLVSTNILDKDEIDSLQNDFSNMDIFSNRNIVIDKLEKQFVNPINTINENCTPLSDDWVDLSAALKEAEFLTDNAFCDVNLTTSTKLYDTPNLEISLEDDDRITPNVLPVTLNVCALRSIEFPYTKKNISGFGKTLCKKWKRKRPILKTIVHYNTVKPFDFSTPYQNLNRS